MKKPCAGHRKGLGMLVKPNCFTTFAPKLVSGKLIQFDLVHFVLYL